MTYLSKVTSGYDEYRRRSSWDFQSQMPFMLQIASNYWRSRKQKQTTTRNVLDCDQSNYSSRIIFSCTFTLEPNMKSIQRPIPEIWPFEIFARWRPAAILDLVQPEVGPFDPPTSKTLPQNQTWSGSDDPFPRYGRSKFYKMQGRSVGRSSILYIVLIHSSPLR